MATVLNLTFVPCTLGPSLTVTQQPNGGAAFRTPRPSPFNVGTAEGPGIAGTTVPAGPQWWPLTG
jgi:hypothetical protein